MECVRRDEMEPRNCLGREIWRAYGEDSAVDDRVSFGFAHFSRRFGEMRPHYHEREWIYVLDAKAATARYGGAFDHMDAVRELRTGDLLRFEKDEVHVFEFQDEEGYLDILWSFDVPMNHTVETAP